MQNSPAPAPSWPQEAKRQQPPSAVADDQYLSLREISAFLTQYGRFIGWTTAAVTGLCLLYAFLATPLYTAYTQILIESRLPQVLRMQLGESTLALDSPQVESQIALLRSEKLTQAVIDKLKLNEDPEFAPARRWNWRALFGNVSAEHLAAQKREIDTATMTKFQRRLDVRRYGLSYVLDVTFASSDADKSARIANALADAYLADQQDMKINAARQASVWRDEQVGLVRERMNQAARAVQEFKARRDYRLGGNAVQRDVTGEAKDATGATSAAAKQPPAVGADRANTLEELEATAQAYRRIYEASLQAYTETVQRQALQFSEARVITLATPPLVQSFPKTYLLTLLGLTLGALLGLGAALVMRALDRAPATPGS